MSSRGQTSVFAGTIAIFMSLSRGRFHRAAGAGVVDGRHTGHLSLAGAKRHTDPVPLACDSARPSHHRPEPRRIDKPQALSLGSADKSYIGRPGRL